jgi:hypothetical protein
VPPRIDFQIPEVDQESLLRASDLEGRVGLRDVSSGPKRQKTIPSTLNERASGDFLLRMGAQASRIPSVPPVSDIVDGFELLSLQRLVKEMEATVNMYFKPGESSAYESVHDVTVRCIKSASKIYGAEEARKDSVGFKLDPVKLASDEVAFEASGYNIAAMALTRQDTHRPHRLNVERLLSLSLDNPEIEHLRSLCGGNCTETRRV